MKRSRRQILVDSDIRAKAVVPRHYQIKLLSNVRYGTYHGTITFAESFTSAPRVLVSGNQFLAGGGSMVQAWRPVSIGTAHFTYKGTPRGTFTWLAMGSA